MDVDDFGARDSTNQPPSRDEPSWLAERTPRRLDAEQAHQPLDPAFVVSFRHAISVEAARDVSFLDDATEALMTSQSASMDVFYPLTLTPPSPELPPELPPEQLLKAFCTTVYSHMPLLQQIPIDCFDQTELSGYLGYAMAAMGSLVINGASPVTHALWSTAKTLITAGLEVDNREARKPSLIDAWILLATYGALCADEITWQQTNICQGYVGTAARRLYHSPKMDHHYNAMPALILADVLRAVHYGHPLTVSTVDYLAGPAGNLSPIFEIYKVLVLDGRSPSSDSSRDGRLLALIAILADIHTLSHIYHSLGLKQIQSTKSTSSSLQSDSLDFYNPFIPLSSENEVRLCRRRLTKALDLWGTAYLSSSVPEDEALYYFCRMYLVLPSLQQLPALAKYTPRVSRDGLVPDTCRGLADDNLKHAQEAHAHAWRIVDVIDQGPGLPSPWLPIAVFYASLVVWRISVLKLGGVSQGSRKVLFIFREELSKMLWPCCETMVATLDNLRT